MREICVIDTNDPEPVAKREGKKELRKFIVLGRKGEKNTFTFNVFDNKQPV